MTKDARFICGEDPCERYDRLADEFYKATGILAPGKDVGAAAASTLTYQERVEAWEKWREERTEE
jgi:hypothetical protein